MLLSLLGMADSGYLFWKHRRSTLLTTGTGGSNFCQAGGCDLVSQGKYAEVRGIPVAAFGIAGYLALFALSVMAAAFGGGSVVGRSSRSPESGWVCRRIWSTFRSP
jgi:uncharacterized membrane protein